jgi:hypothetical protein
MCSTLFVLTNNRQITRLVVVLLCGCFLSAGLAAAATRTQPNTGLGVVRYGLKIAQNPMTSRYGYVIGGAADADRMNTLHGLGLVYKSAMDLDTTCSSGDMCASGVTYAEARAHGWVLSDANGEISCVAYAQNRLADVGSRAFQNAWLRNVQRFLLAHHAHALFIDNVLANVDVWSGGRYPSKYPNNAAWENAMASFVSYVAPRLKQHGIYVVANALKFISGDLRTEDGTLDAGWWRRIGPDVSGLLSEHWQQSPLDTTRMYTNQPGDWTGHWNGWERLVRVAQDMHRDFFGEQWGQSTNTNLLRYGRASFLLEWNGSGGAYIFAAYDGVDPVSRDWATAVGQPRAPRQRVGVGWQREFNAGIVVLNPSQTVSQTFRFSRPYRLPDGSVVTSVELAPASGLILARV